MGVSTRGRDEGTDINYSNIDRHLHRRVKAAEKAGQVETGRGEVRCPCGYNGEPEVIVTYSDWDDSESDYDLFVCPSCGDA